MVFHLFYMPYFRVRDHWPEAWPISSLMADCLNIYVLEWLEQLIRNEL